MSAELDSKVIDNSGSSALSILHVGRTLLADYDYDQNNDSSLEAVNTEKLNESKSLPIQNNIKMNENSNNLINFTNKNVINSSLELVKINDSWHLIDPNICANLSFFNSTHSIKYVENLLLLNLFIFLPFFLKVISDSKLISFNKFID